jgi:hypothetical protein
MPADVPFSGERWVPRRSGLAQRLGVAILVKVVFLSAVFVVFAHLSGDAGFRAENCISEVCTEAR